MDRRLFVSFSGGETSAFMAGWIWQNWRDRYDDIRFVFANTGQENEATLIFAYRVAKHFGFPLTWVEAVVHPGQKKAATHRVVDLLTASRDGEPFEASIAKYGIPNSKFKECTRNLKLNPMVSYLRSIGWKPGTYDTAIGIRNDEVDRISSVQTERRILYPLIRDVPMSKPAVNTYWSKMPFRLGLKGYQGNCKWCWKKSFRKHYTLLTEDASIYDFPARMEAQYGLVGPEFKKTYVEGYRRTFFRGNKSVADIKLEAATKTFTPAFDDAIIFDPDLDVGAGCEESCEVWSDDE